MSESPLLASVCHSENAKAILFILIASLKTAAA